LAGEPVPPRTPGLPPDIAGKNLENKFAHVPKLTGLKGLREGGVGPCLDAAIITMSSADVSVRTMSNADAIIRTFNCVVSRSIRSVINTAAAISTAECTTSEFTYVYTCFMHLYNSYFILWKFERLSTTNIGSLSSSLYVFLRISPSSCFPFLQ